MGLSVMVIMSVAGRHLPLFGLLLEHGFRNVSGAIGLAEG